MHWTKVGKTELVDSDLMSRCPRSRLKSTQIIDYRSSELEGGLESTYSVGTANLSSDTPFRPFDDQFGTKKMPSLRRLRVNGR